MLVCWWCQFDWSYARPTATVVKFNTISIILSSNKIQNGDVLISANPDPSGKWSVKQTEREGGGSEIIQHLPGINSTGHKKCKHGSTDVFIQPTKKNEMKRNDDGVSDGNLSVVDEMNQQVSY